MGRSKASLCRRAFPNTRGLAALPFRRHHPSAPESSPWFTVASQPLYRRSPGPALSSLSVLYQRVTSRHLDDLRGRSDLVACIRTREGASLTIVITATRQVIWPARSTRQESRPGRNLDPAWS